MAIAKPKSDRVQLTVVDVNPAANATTLEGFLGDIKLILMKDYDVFGDPNNDNVGDVHHFTLTRITPAAKVAKPKPKPTPKPNPRKKPGPRPVLTGNGWAKARRTKTVGPQLVCPGSGMLYLGSYGHKETCNHCGRSYMVNVTNRMRRHYK